MVPQWLLQDFPLPDGPAVHQHRAAKFHDDGLLSRLGGLFEPPGLQEECVSTGPRVAEDERSPCRRALYATTALF